MKSIKQRKWDALERKEHENDMRNAIRGTLDKLLEDDEFTRVLALYDDDKTREELIDNAEEYLEDWELSYTDENIIEALKNKIWEDK